MADEYVPVQIEWPEDEVPAGLLEEDAKFGALVVVEVPC